jgi:two-component system LytT family sensor kinase
MDAFKVATRVTADSMKAAVIDEIEARPRSSDNARLQLLVFLLIWPGLNVMVMAGVLADLGRFSLPDFLPAAGRMWLVFALSLAILRPLQKVMSGYLRRDAFWLQLGLYALVIISAGSIIGPPIQAPEWVDPEVGVSLVAPRIFLFLEIAIYLGVQKLVADRERSYAERLARQETELSMLSSQSNPHFLFNTLNLIASEFSRNPENAKEILFDLSDLLRSNIKLAKGSRSTVGGEFKLVELFLQLQQKRFPDRLSFEIHLSPEASLVAVPPLLLQPVIENAIKHAVAPYAAPAQISLNARVSGSRLVIECRDSGPPFDPDAIEEGNGMRILRQTLRLRYESDFTLALDSTPEGGVLRIDIPVEPATI